MGSHCRFIWWLICAMSYKRVFGAKTRKVAMRKTAKWWFWRVFAWRPFAPPGKDTTNSSRKRNLECRVLSCSGAKGRHAKTRKITNWRVFAWRLSAFSPGGATGRHAKTRYKWWFWRVFAWRPFAPPGDTTNRRRKGDAWSVKHEKVTLWRVFAWRLFAPTTQNGTNQPPYIHDFFSTSTTDARLSEHIRERYTTSTRQTGPLLDRWKIFTRPDLVAIEYYISSCRDDRVLIRYRSGKKYQPDKTRSLLERFSVSSTNTPSLTCQKYTGWKPE